MAREELYLYVVLFKRRAGGPNVGYHCGLVFAASEGAANLKAKADALEKFPARYGWDISDVKVEKVSRSVLERAAIEVLGYPRRQ